MVNLICRWRSIDIFDIIASIKSEIPTVYLCSRQIESLILVWNVRSLAFFLYCRFSAIPYKIVMMPS
jgi:hypothetical protein